MISETDETRLGRLEGQMELMVQVIQDLRNEVRAINARIDRLTLAALGMGGGVIVALISLVGVLAVQLARGG
jgi:hypothetical protein